MGWGPVLVCPERRGSGLGSVRLFSFAAGRGGGGMNTGCGERVRNGREGRRKGEKKQGEGSLQREFRTEVQHQSPYPDLSLNPKQEVQKDNNT